MVSVLVPVYNSESVLARCLDSIISQTYKDLEIILVDDGSTDSSPRICDEYAVRDSRIKVIHQKNGGISNARNTGLKNAKGEYIQLVDHDDVIHPQMVEILLALFDNEDYDFSMCYGEPIYDVDLLTERFLLSPNSSNVEELSRDSCMRDLYIGNRDIENQYHWIWNKLYRRDFIANLFFARTEAEDVEFNNRVYLQMNKAILIKERLYFWIQRKESASHQGYNLWYVNILNSYLLCLNEIPHHETLYRSYCLRRLYRLMLSKGYWTIGSLSHEIVNNNNKAILKQTSMELFKNSYIPFVERIVLLLFNYCPFLHRIYMKLIN